jgi:hypothetical protein
VPRVNLRNPEGSTGMYQYFLKVNLTTMSEIARSSVVIYIRTVHRVLLGCCGHVLGATGSTKVMPFVGFQLVVPGIFVGNMLNMRMLLPGLELCFFPLGYNHPC